MRTPDTPLDFQLEPRRQLTCGVYAVRCGVTGKFYIGSSINVSARLAAHRVSLREGSHHNSYLQNAWNKYGDNSFTFKALRVGFRSLRLARMFEALLIKSFGDFNIAEVDLLGNAGHSEETRAKIGAKHRGKVISVELRKHWSDVRKGRPAHNKGVSPSAETRAKMSSARTGLKRSPEAIAKFKETRARQKQERSSRAESRQL